MSDSANVLAATKGESCWPTDRIAASKAIPHPLEYQMNTLLHVNSSPRGPESQSLALARTFLDVATARSPETKVDELNLFDEPMPAFGPVAAAAKYAAFAGQEPDADGAEVWRQVRATFDRMADADSYLFNIPMWNAGVPYVLKQWIDIVTQPGWLFAFNPATGYQGLLTGRRAVVIYTSGVYGPDAPPAFGSDFQRTFFTDWLRFAGISDIREVRLARTALSANPDDDLERAHAEVRVLAETF